MRWSSHSVTRIIRDAAAARALVAVPDLVGVREGAAGRDFVAGRALVAARAGFGGREAALVSFERLVGVLVLGTRPRRLA
jgi:hypothetical protein